jgi:transcriptional regulator with XRE-family HTH domain
MKKRDLDIYRSFGDLVRRGRERRPEPLSQEKLGRLVGLSRTSITNIEKGRHHIVLHQLLAFARALNMPPGALIPRTDSVARNRGVRKKLHGGALTRGVRQRAFAK